MAKVGTHLHVVEKYTTKTGAGNSETLKTNNAGKGYGVVYYDCGGASRTGVILEAGVEDGQKVVVVNTSDAAETITFATGATSKVALGTSAVIGQNQQMTFTWSSTLGRWVSAGGSATLAAGQVTTTELAETTIQYAAVSLTNANMLNLRATPIELVAAPGAGKVIEFVSAVLLFDYTGAYTESADNMAIRYTNGSGVIVSETIEATGFVDATADTMTNAIAKADAIVSKTGSENQALVLHNTGDGEYGGGNAGNAVRVKVAYRVHTTGF